MRLNREQVLSLADACHIALTERETAALETELNDLSALSEQLTAGNAADKPRDARAGESVPCRARAMRHAL